MVARDKTGASNESDFWNLLALLCLVFVLLTSFFTYFYRYQEPQAPFWDENYYITDAEVKHSLIVIRMIPHSSIQSMRENSPQNSPSLGTASSPLSLDGSRHHSSFCVSFSL